MCEKEFVCVCVCKRETAARVEFTTDEASQRCECVCERVLCEREIERERDSSTGLVYYE